MVVVLEESWQVIDGNSQFNLTGHGGDGEVVGCTIVGLRDSMTELQRYLKSSIQEIRTPH